MKNFFCSLLLLAGLSGTAAAQAPAAALAATDTVALKAYTGRYKMKSDFFDVLLVRLENGKLVGEAVGQGSGGLVPDATTPDLFLVPEHSGSVKFERDATGKVIGLTLTIQGQPMAGVREDQP